MARKAAVFEVKKFVPNDQKAREIEDQVAKQGKEEQDQQSQSPALAESDDIEGLKKRYAAAKEDMKAAAEPLLVGQRPSLCSQLVVEEFEKDQDDNYHVDFMYAMANIRAQNYGLTHMDWITVKIKAGRIVPALATTTAAIAGLQTIELLKFLRGLQIESHRNAFLNLAVPSLMMGEPGPAQRFKLCDGLSVSLWDRWEFHAASSSTTLADILQHLATTYHGGSLVEKDVLHGSRPLFLHALAALQHPGLEGRSFPELQRPLLDILSEFAPVKDAPPQHLNLVVTFTIKGEEEMLSNVPEVRVYFEK